MKNPSASALSFVTLSLALVLTSTQAAAQQQPITGQMMGPGSPAPTTPASVGAAAPATHRYAAAVVSSPPPAPVAQTDMAGTEAPPSTVARPRAHGTPVGETTRTLLQMQADGSQAGKPLPMLGAEASASYARYLKSFNHDIPEFYKTTVGKSGGDTGSGER